MPQFDIVSKVDLQTLDNAINTAKKEIENRYDFRGSNTELTLDKKTMIIHVVTEDDMKMDQVETVLISKFVKNRIDPLSLDFGKENYAAGKQIKKDIQVKQGIDKEAAKKIVKAIKDTKLKVQASIMEDQVRVTSAKIDFLQDVISMCRTTDFGVALQFDNMK
jgi:cyclic-di-GMP-binding protein